MRLFDLKIDGQNYKACCGLRVLAELQKKYNTLKEFENKIVPKNNDDIDIQAVIDTAVLFTTEGAKAAGTNAPDEDTIYNAGGVYDLANALFMIYAGSMLPENEDDEKNSESQTKM